MMLLLLPLIFTSCATDEPATERPDDLTRTVIDSTASDGATLKVDTVWSAIYDHQY